MVELPVGFRFHKDAIRDAATAAGLDTALVAAVCWQESSFNADAFRHEPAFWNRYLKTNPKYRHLNPRRVSSSYGLMQPMYCRVLEDKMTDNDALPPEHLFVPEMNLRTGCQLLRELLDWAGARTTDPARATEAALAAYNGGRGGNSPAEPVLRNGKYAREVLAKLAILKSQNAFATP
jgi:soluble lytic murein transglycosylase-like protein